MGSKPPELRIALTADLHYGTRHTAGNLATLELVAHLFERQPDAVILAGDIGAGDDFGRCLDLFAPLPCLKALVPGNHDIWVTSTDARGDSWRVYAELLPRLANERGFHYLDHGPLMFPEVGLAVAGSMNWYDYSWAIDDLKSASPDWEYRLRTKRFTRGRHNDANYVRWPHTDASFAALAVEKLTQQIDDGLRQMDQAVVVTHHPACRALNYPAPEPVGFDDLLWRAFSGNQQLEDELSRRADRIAFAFSGHTHYAREADFRGIRAVNIGGDYHFKRVVWLHWPSGRIEAVEFGGQGPNGAT